MTFSGSSISHRQFRSRCLYVHFERLFSLSSQRQPGQRRHGDGLVHLFGWKHLHPVRQQYLYRGHDGQQRHAADGNGGTGTSLASNIANNSTLVFNCNGTTYSGVISGSGPVFQQGTGTLQLAARWPTATRGPPRSTAGNWTSTRRPARMPSPATWSSTTRPRSNCWRPTKFPTPAASPSTAAVSST